MQVDRRKPALCPRLSVPGSTLSTTLASSHFVPVRPPASEAATPTVSTVQLPSATPDLLTSSTLAVPPIRLRFHVAPSSMSRTSPVRARTSAASKRIPFPSAEHTESLYVHEAPPSDASSRPHPPSGAHIPPNPGPSTPTSVPSKKITQFSAFIIASSALTAWSQLLFGGLLWSTYASLLACSRLCRRIKPSAKTPFELSLVTVPCDSFPLRTHRIMGSPTSYHFWGRVIPRTWNLRSISPSFPQRAPSPSLLFNS